MALISSVVLDMDWIYRMIPERSSGAPIGKVISLSGRAKRRVAGDLIWRPVHPGDHIYKRDLLSTGADSEMDIDLDHAISMSMKPNSLIEVDRWEQTSRVQLSGGQLAMSSSGPEPVVLETEQSQPMKMRLAREPVTVSGENLRDPAFRQKVVAEANEADLAAPGKDNKVASESSSDSKDAVKGEAPQEDSDSAAPNEIELEKKKSDSNQSNLIIFLMIGFFYAFVAIVAVLENRSAAR